MYSINGQTMKRGSAVSLCGLHLHICSLYKIRVSPCQDTFTPSLSGREGGGSEGWKMEGCNNNLPKTVMELETSMASNQTAAILKPTIRFVDV